MSPEEPLVGSTHDPFTSGSGAPSALEGSTVQIGHIDNGEISLTHPSLSVETL